jgi:FAD/FMN-containing dehydrogenase
MLPKCSLEPKGKQTKFGLFTLSYQLLTCKLSRDNSTLGIVTECTVRLAPKLPIKVATTAFPTVDAAVRTVVDLLNKGVQVTCVELLDDMTMKAINLSGQMSKKYPEKPHLFSGFTYHEESWACSN